jgi:hypothetical protein
MKLLLTFFTALLGVIPLGAASLDTNLILRTTGLPGAWNPRGRSLTVTLPRTDVKVAIDQWPLPASMGLTSWASFRAGKKAEASVTGELVLFQDEVSPVMSVAFANGLDVTGLHDRFFHEEPRVCFLQIAGEGRAEQLARAVRRALDRGREIRTALPQPASRFAAAAPPATNGITLPPLEKLLGTRAQLQDGTVRFVLAGPGRDHDAAEAKGDAGLNNWAAFAGTDTNTVVDGCVMARERALSRVLRALRHYDIHIVAIHQMFGETPRMASVSFWGRGRAVHLAEGIQTALKAEASLGR